MALQRGAPTSTVVARDRPPLVRARRTRALCRVRALGDVAGDPPRRRPLPRAAGRGPRAGSGRRPPAARLGLLARRPSARERGLAALRPVLVPPRGGGAAERAGLAARRAVLAPARRLRRRVGVRPPRPADVRRGGRARVLVAARPRPVAPCGARRRPRLLPHAVSRRAVDGAPPRARLLPAAGDAPGARAATLRAGGGVPRRRSALGPAPSRARRDPARARLRVGSPSALGVVEGRCRRARGARRGPRRRAMGGCRARSASGGRSGRSSGTRPRSRTSCGGRSGRASRSSSSSGGSPRWSRSSGSSRCAGSAGSRCCSGSRRSCRASSPSGRTCRATRRSGASCRASSRRASRSASCRSRASRSPRWSRSASSAAGSL